MSNERVYHRPHAVGRFAQFECSMRAAAGRPGLDRDHLERALIEDAILVAAELGREHPSIDAANAAAGVDHAIDAGWISYDDDGRLVLTNGSNAA